MLCLAVGFAAVLAFFMMAAQNEAHFKQARHGKVRKKPSDTTMLDHTRPYWTILLYLPTFRASSKRPFFPYQYQGLSWNFSESCQWLVCALGGRTYHAIHGIHDIHDIHSFQGQGRRCLRSFSQRWDASWRPTTFVPILASPAVKPSVVHHALRTASWGLGGKKSRGRISEA